MTSRRLEGSPLSAEDLGFWYADQPRQRTTMAMLMLLDRAPDPARLRAAARARSRRCRGCASAWSTRPSISPCRAGRTTPPSTSTSTCAATRCRRTPPGRSDGRALPHLGPIYERPFDRTRPLWELIEIDRPGGAPRSSSASITRWRTAWAATRSSPPSPTPSARASRCRRRPGRPPGAWPETSASGRAGARRARPPGAGRARARGRRARALGRAARARSLVAPPDASAASLRTTRDTQSESPLRDFGRARRLAGLELDFEPPARGPHARSAAHRRRDADRGRRRRRRLAPRRTGIARVRELLTLVPINLRPRAAQGLAAGVGNRATGILVRLPMRIADPARAFARSTGASRSARRTRSADCSPARRGRARGPAAAALSGGRLPQLAGARADRHQRAGRAGAALRGGRRDRAAYPFAPVAPHCPVSVALYGYRDRLFVGLDADATAVPDVDVFCSELARSFERVVAASR